MQAWALQPPWRRERDPAGSRPQPGPAPSPPGQEINGGFGSQGDGGNSMHSEALRPPSGEVYTHFDSLLF